MDKGRAPLFYCRLTRGFTLIELLVVVSIISFLASIMLSALNSARVKADNAARLSLVREYKKALEFSYDADDERYPSPVYNGWLFTCLGDYVDDQCSNGSATFPENPNAASAIGRYLPGRPPLKPIYGASGVRYDGPIYSWQCIGPRGCGYILSWFLEGNDLDCGFGITSNDAGDRFGFKWNFSSYFTECSLVLR